MCHIAGIWCPWDSKLVQNVGSSMGRAQETAMLALRNGLSLSNDLLWTQRGYHIYPPLYLGPVWRPQFFKVYNMLFVTVEFI